jgi:hypothetical protein
MQELAKTVFIAKWKSFKVFQKTGEIKLHSEQHYREFLFKDSGTLLIKSHKGGQVTELANTNGWMVELKEKRHYLKLPLYKIIYEVVTVNHTVLVLLDNSTSEKTFFAKEMHWHSYLNSNTHIVL